MIAGLGIVLPALTGTWAPFGVDVTWRQLPVGACDFMAAQGVRGRGFNAFEQGGYLLFRFWPDRERLPFLDIHQAGTEQDLADYAAMLEEPAPWQELDRRRRFDWALVQSPPQADALDADSSFVPVYREDAAVLYVRRDGPLAAVARRHAYRILPGGNRALEQVGARSVSDPGFAALAESEARRAAGESRWNGKALSLLSNLEALRGDRDDARAHLEQAVRVLPNLPFAHERLGRMAMEAGRPRDALEHYARQQRAAGLTPRLAFETARAWGAAGEVGQARDWYRRALELDPDAPGARDSLDALEARGAR
jgi:tetratricopeptide (TPR) repeat protein